LLNELHIQYDLTDRIHQAQKNCKEIEYLRGLMKLGYKTNCNNPSFWKSQKYELFKFFPAMRESCRC